MSGKVAQGPPSPLGEGTIQPERLDRFGSVVTMSAQQQWVLEGRVWQVTVGTLSTPILAGGAGTVIDADQPELVIDVPGGTVAVICNVRADAQPGVTATDADEFEILLAVDRLAVSGATATNGVVETPVGFRTNLESGSRCTVVSAVTTNLGGAPTLSMELAHPVIIGVVDGTPTSTTYTSMLFLDYDPSIKPYIVGPATIVLYAGGTVATDLFASAVWAEFTTQELGL